MRLTLNPIHKVLSTLRSNRVLFLLVGGQACILYGAAEFSRDTDIVILAEASNLRRLRAALRDLDAEGIAVPPLSVRWLKKGHAVRFRCRHPDAAGIRVDIMSVMRGVASFGELWKRRTSVDVQGGETFDLMALPDLVQSKKTQRDKDWPMLRRLIEAHHVENRKAPTRSQVCFWLEEARTPELLIELASRYPEDCRRAEKKRPLLALARGGRDRELENALAAEEKSVREADRAYWEPLRRELEGLRHRKVRDSRRKGLRRPSTMNH